MKKSVVIIEDETMIREGLRQFLEWEGFDVSVAENGEKGLEVLRKQKNVCAIVVDLQMPVMTGEQFLDVVKQEETLKEVPILVLTARSEPLNRGDITAVIKKPIELDDFLGAVKKICGDPSS